MQPDTDERPATETSTDEPLTYTDLANQETDQLVKFLGRLGQDRHLSSIGGSVAAELLTRDGITQRELADKCGIPQSTISRWVARAGAA
ncbi:helix-turn-helix domain-containing protein [Amycolatopsis thailandensis]|uniref:helix-turn-helix domain-containing protein n=1 Tax=Amycolatopsis thailandensis TaxID=589330 RepID=UPI0036520065